MPSIHGMRLRFSLKACRYMRMSSVRQWYRAAQVQQVNKKDQSISLSMRGSKFCKLHKGRLVTVPASCIRRKSSHFVEVPKTDIQIVTGCNGWLWLGALDPARQAADSAGRVRPFGAAAAVDVAAVDFTARPEQWQAIARHAQAAAALARLRLPIHPAVLAEVVTLSAQQGVSCAGMLDMQFLHQLVAREAQRRGHDDASMDVA